MELIEKILKIESIQRKRKEKNKLNQYNTGEKIHKKQLLFHQSEKKNRRV